LNEPDRQAPWYATHQVLEGRANRQCNREAAEAEARYGVDAIIVSKIHRFFGVSTEIVGRPSGIVIP
jgi:hypothetical protein